MISQILQIIGILISVVGYIIFFIQGNYAIGFLFVIIAAGLTFYVWDSRQPDYSVIFRDDIWTIEDEQGSRAKSEKVLKVRANHKGLPRYIHRNISADGQITGFETNYGSVDYGVRGGDHEVYHKFPIGLKKWQAIEFNLIMEMENCFTGNPEGVIMLVDAKTKKANIRIILPETRVCGGARAIYRHGIEERQLEPPRISSNRREISWTGKKLNKIGSEYEIEWDW